MEMKMTQCFVQHDLKGPRMLKLSRFFLGALALSWTAAAHAAPVAYTLIGVTLSDGGTASGTFNYDAAAKTYSNLNIVTTTAGTRSGATYISTSSCFAPDSVG